MNTNIVSDRLLAWYSGQARPYPWREQPTPYRVWVSEIMLQQTRIEAALPYYDRFISALPDVSALAAVSQEDLLKLWEGLGYYSRARNLQKAAQRIVAEYGGELPADHAALLSLPGIGAYTAGAIASIAFSIPVPAVDGNVMRVLARLTGDDTDVLSAEGKKHFTKIAESLVPVSDPGNFNQALMELGETVCVPAGAPRCECCPLQDQCTAYAQGNAETLPTRIQKTKRRIEERQVAVVIASGSLPAVMLHQREQTGLLAGMWEIPNTEVATPLEALPDSVRACCVKTMDLPAAKHLFSHIEWRMRGYVYSVAQPVDLPEGYAWVTGPQLRDGYPLPGAFRAYTKLFPKLLSEENGA